MNEKITYWIYYILCKMIGHDPGNPIGEIHDDQLHVLEPMILRCNRCQAQIRFKKVEPVGWQVWP